MVMPNDKRWVGTWAAAPAPAEGILGFNNQTFRLNARLSIGGERLRVRISNAYGNRPLLIGAAMIALRDKGPTIVAGSGRKLSFGRCDSAIIAAGAVQYSDAVDLSVPPLADLVVSFHLPSEVPANFVITGRYARQTNYISPPGNFAAETAMPVGNLTDQWFFLCGVDVLAASDALGVVALGELADRREHLGNRRLLPLARSIGATARRPRRQAGRRDEQRAWRQPHPARHPWRQRAPAVRPRRAGAAGRHTRHCHARHQ